MKNPNNPAHKDAQDNNARQRNPQDPKHQPPPEPQPSPGKKEVGSAGEIIDRTVTPRCPTCRTVLQLIGTALT